MGQEFSCGATQVDAILHPLAFLLHIITGRSDNGCGPRRLLLASRMMLSAALISPFARARLPQFHRLRLSFNRGNHVTSLNHRFENDYRLPVWVCQACLHKISIPNIQIPPAMRLFGKTKLLQKCDATTFGYKVFMRQNIMELCYFYMKFPKSLDRFRLNCYNKPRCRERTAAARSLKTIQRERQGKQNSQISERETPVRSEAELLWRAVAGSEGTG